MIPDFVAPELAALGIELAHETLERLDAYLDLLLEANQRTNLTAIRERDAAWRRLLIDSLTPLPGLQTHPPAKAVDIGTGAGLPGIPLAIALPQTRFSLIDSTGKKIAFLRSVVESLSLPNVDLHPERVETLGQESVHREQYDLAISRAVGPMNVILEYSLPLLRVGGLMVAMKGPKVTSELEVASDALLKLGGELETIDSAYPAAAGNDLVLVSITKAQPTPRSYPRLPGTPKREPL